MSLQLQAGVSLESCLGRGGMGEVWAGTHHATGLPVAVKLTSSLPGAAGERATSMKALRAFTAEVRAIAAMSHPDVIRVLDYGVTAADPLGMDTSAKPPVGTPFLVMERAFGGTLREHARRELDWSTIRYLLMAMLRGLAHVHARGIIHRDLKPSNVLVMTDRPLVQARIALADFGIAAPLANLKSSGGTPAYMAPEQHLGLTEQIGPWTDLYALGCVAWELACGSRPFQDDSTGQVAHQHCYSPRPPLRPRGPVPTGFGDWVHRLLAPKRSARFNYAAEALATLQTLGGAAIGPALPRPAETEPNWREATFTAAAMSMTSAGAISRIRATEGHSIGSFSPAMPPPITWKAVDSPPNSPALLAAGAGLLGLREGPLVGRRNERNALWAAFGSAIVSKQPQMVILQGEPGLGKSRLARWLLRQANEVCAAETLEFLHAPQPGPRYGLLRGLAATGVLLQGGAPAGSDESDTLEQAARTLAARATQRPCVVLIDDAHWAEDTLAWLRQSFERSLFDECPVVFILTVRSDIIAQRPDAVRSLGLLTDCVPNAARIDLAPLSEVELHTIARDLLGLDQRAADRVVRRATGHPLLLRWVLESWVRTGALAPTSRGYVLRDGIDPDTIPLPQSWTERAGGVLDPLPTDVSRAVEIGAALGLRFEVEEWEQILGANNLVLPDATELEVLARAGLLSFDGREGVFGHGLVRAAVEARSRSAGRWQDCCRACLNVLHTADAPLSNTLAERVGRLAADAGDWTRALPALEQSADSRFRRSEYAAAHSLLTLHEDGANQIGLRASDPIRRRALAIRMWIYQMQSEHGQLERVAREVLAGADDSLDVTVGDACVALGWVLMVDRQRPEESLQIMTDGYAIFEALGHAVGMGRCALLLNGLARRRMDLDAMERWVARSQQHFERADDVRGIIAALHSGIELERRRGRFDKALNYYRRAATLAGAHHPFDMARLALVRGHIAVVRGEEGMARESFERAISVAVSLHVDDQAQEARIGLAMLELTQGELPRSHELLATVTEIASRHRQRAIEGQLSAAWMAWSLHAGDQAAYETARSAFEQWESSNPYVDPEVDRYRSLARAPIG